MELFFTVLMYSALYTSLTDLFYYVLYYCIISQLQLLGLYIVGVRGMKQERGTLVE
jgi:hypothetical protein